MKKTLDLKPKEEEEQTKRDNKDISTPLGHPSTPSTLPKQSTETQQILPGSSNHKEDTTPSLKKNKDSYLSKNIKPILPKKKMTLNSHLKVLTKNQMNKKKEKLNKEIVEEKNLSIDFKNLVLNHQRSLEELESY